MNSEESITQTEVKQERKIYSPPVIEIIDLNLTILGGNGNIAESDGGVLSPS